MDFKTFWPIYAAAHSHPANRKLHAVGTVLAMLTLVLGAILQQWLYFPLALVIGYGCAWTGHFFIEGNRPATFHSPLLSLRGDFHLCFLVLTGRFKEIST